MDNIETALTSLLTGNDIKQSNDLCDFTLEDQNEVAVAKGECPTAPPDFTPVVRQSVCYVVMAVILNDKKEVLMMQEAKKSCSGLWYLPAGRIEASESIVDAFKREVLEETGLFAEPTGMLMVESAGGSWYRFVLSGVIKGGNLKTVAQADSESLQAKWAQNLSDYNLRASDIVNIVEHARAILGAPEHPIPTPNLLPSMHSYNKLYLRLLICARKKANNAVHVLVSEKTTPHFPVCEIHPGRSLHAVLKKFMTEMFGASLPSHRPHGLLAIGHHPSASSSTKPTDGIALSLLVSIRLPIEEISLIDKYSWLPVREDVAANLLSRMGKYRTVPLNVLRTTSESDA